MNNEGVTPVIGIDLGTRYSCVGVYYQGKVEIITRTMPSFVAFTPTERLIGEDAKNQVTENSANTIYAATRLLGRRYDDPEVQEGIKSWPFKVIKGNDGFPKIVVEYKGKEKQYSAEEISSIVLVQLKNLAESYLGTNVRDAVITVPAYFKDSHRQAMKVAAHLAGLDVVQIIDEPVVAAIAYGLHTKTNESNVVVFDVDEDRFDVSLVNISVKGNLTVKATCGDHIHFGVQMVDYFVKEFKRKHNIDLSGNLKALGKLRYHSDRAIQDLSSDFKIQTTIYISCLHEDIDFSTTITRAKFEYINRSFSSKLLETVENCLRDAKINKTDVDDIVLVGNSIRLMQELAREFFHGKAFWMTIQPEEVVTYGAATFAEYQRIEKGKKPKNLPLVDIVPLSLGVDAHDGVFSVIIPRNTPIPAEKENIYFTTRDNQDSIWFNVYQGERSRARDNNWLGKFEVAISLAPRRKSKVKVVFNVDANGTFNCWVKEFTTGLKREIIIDNDKMKRSEEEIDDMMKDAERYKLDDHEYKKIMRSRNALEEYIYNVKRKMKTIGSTDKTRIYAEEIREMVKAIEDANQYLDINPELADVDEYQKVQSQLEKICVSVISQLV